MKYRVHKIEHNYNQIWHGIKANKIHSCKLQLYNTHNKQRLTQITTPTKNLKKKNCKRVKN